MFVLFLLLMEQHLIADAAHEWMGIAVFALFLLHNVLNYRWYAALFRGRYNGLRIVQTVINFLLWLFMLGCIVSSLMISGTVFSGIVIPGSRYGAMIHMVCTAWVFVLMSLHLGLHWAQIRAMDEGESGRFFNIDYEGMMGNYFVNSPPREWNGEFED